MIRILIAEDHALVRDGLRLLISVQNDMEVVGDAVSGDAVLPLVQAHRPDVLLLDLGLPRMDGLAIMQTLSRLDLSVRVLIVTARMDQASAHACLALGAAGYLLKSENSDVLLTAIREVASGRRHLGQEVVGLLGSQEPVEPSALTAREREVLQLVGQGLSSKEIAQRLEISDLTVRKHRENLCRKLQVHHTAELVAYAIRAERILRTQDEWHAR